MTTDEFVNDLFNRITADLGIVGWRWEWSEAGGYCWYSERLLQLHPHPISDYDRGEDTHTGYAQQLIHEIAHIFIPSHLTEFWNRAEELAFRYLGTGLNEWQIEAAKIYAPEWKARTQ